MLTCLFPMEFAGNHMLQDYPHMTVQYFCCLTQQELEATQKIVCVCPAPTSFLNSRERNAAGIGVVGALTTLQQPSSSRWRRGGTHLIFMMAGTSTSDIYIWYIIYNFY